MIEIIIPGPPYALQRPRFGGGRAYDPQANRDAKKHIATIAREAWGDRPTITGPVKLTCMFVYAWPKSATKAQRGRPNGFYRHKRPDIDNCLKAIMDGVNDAGNVWQDDGQVAAVYAEQIHCNIEPMTRVTIEALWEQE